MAAPPYTNKVSYETLLQTAIETSEIEALDEIENTLGDAIRKETLENDKRIKNAEPFCYLGEVMENRATKADVEIGQRQRFLLQAAALYNFVKKYTKLKNHDEDDLLEIVQAATERVRESLASSMGRNIDGHRLMSGAYKSELQEIREYAESFLKRMETPNTKEEIRETFYVEQQVQVRELLETISSRIKRLLSRIIQDCLEILGEAPCHYEVIVLGSLARGEMTPYSDLEWAILTSSEKEEYKTFFRNLANLVHLEVINLGETILPGMNIRVLSGGWFYDDLTPRGVSFDGLLPQACKTPLGNFLVGNAQRFELIHTPATMVEYQSDDWYKTNPGLAEILLTVAPLSADDHNLVDEYIGLLRKFLSTPCNLGECHHHESSAVPPCSIRKCRSTISLGKDVAKYGEFSFASKQKLDGKLYDVKKDIYRLTDRVIAGLGSYFDIASNGAFAVLRELLDRKKIGSTARDNLASAVGIALKLRVYTYLKVGKQGEVMKNDASDGDLTWEYRLPNEHELFHFFYVSTPVYEKLYQFFNDRIVQQSLDVSEEEFFDRSESMKGDLFCRLSKYPEALKCYQRALDEDTGDVLLKLNLLRVKFIKTNTLDLHEYDELLRELSRKYNPDSVGENQVSKLQYFGSDLKLMDVRLLVEMFSWLSLQYELIGDFAVAKNLLSQSMNAMGGKLGFDQEGFGMLLAEAYLQRNCASLSSNSSDAIERSQLIVPRLVSFIEHEGESMRSLQILHELVEILCKGEKYVEAYNWLQHGLKLCRDLYGGNTNFRMAMTLIKLVEVCDKLNMHEDRACYLVMFKPYRQGYFTGN